MSLKLPLGVGLGIGIPILVLAIIICIVCTKRYRQTIGGAKPPGYERGPVPPYSATVDQESESYILREGIATRD